MNTYSSLTLTSALALCALLTGCATTSQIDSEVTSFMGPGASGGVVQGTVANSSANEVAKGTFRFDRLPSQQKDAAQAGKMEAWALPALEKAGFKQSDANAQFNVQLSAYSMEEPRGLEYNRARYSYFYSGYDRVVLYRGRLISFGPSLYAPGLLADIRNFVSGLSVVVRSAATGQVVYETSAVNEQRWFDAGRVFPALALAAMDGYPAASSDKRKVSVTVPWP